MLCVTGMGSDMDAARDLTYEAYDRIDWAGKFCRRDIGTRVESRKERIAKMMGKAEGGARGR